MSLQRIRAGFLRPRQPEAAIHRSIVRVFYLVGLPRDLTRKVRTLCKILIEGRRFRQAFLTKAFLMRPTPAVTIAPVMPPPANCPAIAPISKPPALLAALPRAGISPDRIVPPMPPPAAPVIVLTRGLRSIFLRRPPATFPPIAPATS